MYMYIVVPLLVSNRNFKKHFPNGGFENIVFHAWLFTIKLSEATQMAEFKSLKAEQGQVFNPNKRMNSKYMYVHV